MECNLLKYHVEPPHWRQAFPISPRSGLAYVEQRKLGKGFSGKEELGRRLPWPQVA